jgi:TonB family protein
MQKLNSSKITIYKLWILFLIGFVLLFCFQQLKPGVKFTENMQHIIELPIIAIFATYSYPFKLQQNTIAWESIALMVWFSVSIFLILKLLYKYRKFKKSLDFKSNILDNNIVKSAFVKSPVAFGIKSPQIFVPPDYKQTFSQSQQNLLMQHEQVHCDRKDPLVLMLYKVLTHIFWFHPIVYILNNYMKKDQEISCDEIVLNNNNQSVEYSKLLFQLNQLTYFGNTNPELYCSSISMLKERIMLINNLKPKSFINSFISKTILLLSAVGLIVTTSALSNIVKPHNIQKPLGASKGESERKTPMVIKKNATQITAPLSAKVSHKQNTQIIPISTSAPAYPREAVIAKITGYVVVEFDVTTDGTVENLQVIESIPEKIFNKEALGSVKKYLFKPISKKTRIRQRVEFKLGNDSTILDSK